MSFWHSTSGDGISAEIPKGAIRGISRGAAQGRVKETAGNGPVDEGAMRLERCTRTTGLYGHWLVVRTKRFGRIDQDREPHRPGDERGRDLAKKEGSHEPCESGEKCCTYRYYGLRPKSGSGEDQGKGE